MFKKLIVVFLVSVTVLSCKTSHINLEGLPLKEQLQTLFPTAEISDIKIEDHFTQAYQIIVKQPLDHNNKEAGYFDHYIYISHNDYAMPTVLITEGYSARQQTYELSSLLKSNQVMVEYRFYGKSRPNPIPWDYLTNDQAIEDYHAIVNKLKLLYKNKWISTGISKGGETVLIYKSKYPKDVDVAVPYVAPLIDTQEDKRTEQHLKTVGSDECRAKISNFQRLVLENRDEVLLIFSSVALAQKLTFNKMPLAEALEYAILEFPFSFWQWGNKCQDIPDAKATPKDLANYLQKVVGIGFYSDQDYHKNLPSFYQHMIELGYYGFDTAPVKDLIKIAHRPTNLRFAPKDVSLTYNPEYIKNVRNYVENKGDKILYIYGEYDPWGACAPTPLPKVDALKMVLKGGHHGTKIKDFSRKDKQIIYTKLQDWLGKNVEFFIEIK